MKTLTMVLGAIILVAVLFAASQAIVHVYNGQYNTQAYNY